MSGSVIEAANVSKILGSGPARVQALKDVNLTIRCSTDMKPMRAPRYLFVAAISSVVSSEALNSRA